MYYMTVSMQFERYSRVFNELSPVTTVTALETENTKCLAYLLHYPPRFKHEGGVG